MQEDMIKTKKNISRLLGNKYLWIFVSVILIIIVAYCQIDRYRKTHSSLYINLQGTYEMLLDSAIIDRSFDMQPLGFYLYFNGCDIVLPPIKCIVPFTNGELKYQEISKIVDDTYGSWEVVSSNPDSIFVNANAHVLHGKYKVTFVTETDRYIPTYYVYLDNDSTHLCLKKIE